MVAPWKTEFREHLTGRFDELLSCYIQCRLIVRHGATSSSTTFIAPNSNLVGRRSLLQCGASPSKTCHQRAKGYGTRDHH